MTEEEMAEAYEATKHYRYEDNDYCGDITDGIKQAYLAGLKAGKPQWHDLREDPNDLPKKDCEVVNLHENGNKTIQKWKNGNWTNAIVIPVIAWHEIPQFKDKE